MSPRLHRGGLPALADPMTSSEFIEWRKRLGWTRAVAATALGLSASRLGDYERGKTRGRETEAPIPRVVELACEALEDRQCAGVARGKGGVG